MEIMAIISTTLANVELHTQCDLLVVVKAIGALVAFVKHVGFGFSPFT